MTQQFPCLTNSPYKRKTNHLKQKQFILPCTARSRCYLEIVRVACTLAYLRVLRYKQGIIPHNGEIYYIETVIPLSRLEMKLILLVTETPEVTSLLNIHSENLIYVQFVICRAKSLRTSRAVIGDRLGIVLGLL